MAYVDLNDAIISQVRDSADIVDFVSQVTPLKPSGKSFKGLCPFHREKTPSFHVDRAKGLFYCFGCGTGGDIFKFLILTERFTFPEAVEHVASRTGIKLPSRRNASRDSDKDDLLGLLVQAEDSFRLALQWRPNIAATYLEQRNVSTEVQEKYGFGFAPDSWDYLLSRLGTKYPVQKLEAAGLVLPRKGGTGYYDRFRNRLMIPIHSENGNLIGFGGRTLDGSDPKYLNSPESSVFNKSHLLYNLNRSRDKIRKTERAILVEGYFDAIALDHAGIPGVVASMGTSLTPGQASLLRKFARRVVVAYDGDSAGRNAAVRAAPVLLSAGLAVDILDVGADLDPDSLIQKGGVEAYGDALDAATDVFEFALRDWVPNPAVLTTREKSARLEEFVPLLSSVSDPVGRNDAAQRIADGLRLEFDTVWSRVRGRGTPQKAQRDPTAPITTGEKQLLAALLNGEMPLALQERLREDLFEDSSCRTIYALVKDALLSRQPLDFSYIATHLKVEADLTRLSELALGDETEQPELKGLEETVRLMERRFLDRRLKEIQSGIQDAVRAEDGEREHSLFLEKLDISRQLHALK
ncbi:MAG: DNA primase [Acidobacteriota bacterium]